MVLPVAIKCDSILSNLIEMFCMPPDQNRCDFTEPVLEIVERQTGVPGGPSFRAYQAKEKTNEVLPKAVLWVINEYLSHLDRPNSYGLPLILWSLKGDYADEELMQISVQGYLSPGSDFEDLVGCYKSTLRGEMLKVRSRLPWPWNKLTPRQRTITRYLLAGETKSSIANYLHIQTDTVHDHIKAIYAKLGINHRQELINHCLYHV